MHLNTDAPADLAPAKKPCMRDLHELVTHFLPDPKVLKLVPLDELERFGTETVAEHPRFAEEMPLVLAYETRRRARHQRLVGSRTPAIPLAIQAYHLA
ncbi:hypothetical protein [Hymenobacter terricola]|uniref:hypothetical protein n=1 Tax=Hymenobacter terricola TaxID=2819236 RepID=UPI001B311742|nr:hypothetical protein [Hymenobacter terricola]